ncbi:uncharacterized protein MKZ38_010204 [Zalerion maritima]|uniref:Complex III subunit 7 n=1 Tax=Zalerion maritima TaxID=339359 RepID=A0AAD5RU60_9PEZI|nr:uncharacterized protein MKZ38_010204 [Zalerion maritima]
MMDIGIICTKLAQDAGAGPERIGLVWEIPNCQTSSFPVATPQLPPSTDNDDHRRNNNLLLLSTLFLNLTSRNHGEIHPVAFRQESAVADEDADADGKHLREPLRLQEDGSQVSPPVYQPSRPLPQQSLSSSSPTSILLLNDGIGMLLSLNWAVLKLYTHKLPSELNRGNGDRDSRTDRWRDILFFFSLSKAARAHAISENGVFANVFLSNFRNYRADDLIAEDSELVLKALKRLPQNAAYDRVYRIRRAVQLSVQHRILPKEEWIKDEEDVPYLSYIIEQIQAEEKEKNDLDSMTVIKSH